MSVAVAVVGGNPDDRQPLGHLEEFRRSDVGHILPVLGQPELDLMVARSKIDHTAHASQEATSEILLVSIRNSGRQHTTSHHAESYAGFMPRLKTTEMRV